MADDPAEETKEALVSPSTEESNDTKSCVDMKLNQFVRDRRIIPLIESAVERLNIITLEAYEFANFHVHRLIHAGLDVPNPDRNFYYRCIICVAQTNARISTVPDAMAESARLFSGLRPPGQQPVDARDIAEIIPDITITMQTAAYNHLWENLLVRTGRWLKCQHPTLKKFFSLILALAFKKPQQDLAKVAKLKTEHPAGSRKPPLSDAEVQLRVQAADVITYLRGMCKLKSSKKAKSRSHMLFPLYWQIHKDFERMHSERRLAKFCGEKTQRTAARRFDLLPRKKSFAPIFIPIQSRFLLSTLLSLKNKDKGEAQPMSAGLRRVAGTMEADAIWRTWFNINSVETCTKRFGYRIVTDGVSVTVVMNKPACHLLATTDATDDRIVISGAPTNRPMQFAGVDPGYGDVVTVAHQTRRDVPPPGKSFATRTKSYSGRKYYEDAKINASRRRTDKWNEDTRHLHDLLRAERDHGDFSEYQLSMRYTLANARVLLAHRMTRGYRNMRFLRKRFKMKAVNDICDLIAPSDKFTVVGYGDWKGSPGSPIKRKCSGPQQAIKRELLRRQSKGRCLFAHISEFRTSILSSDTWERMTNMHAKSVTRQWDGTLKEQDKPSKVHKVLHCKNSGKTTWNRDVNAARNILMLLMRRVNGQARPQEFCRNG